MTNFQKGRLVCSIDVINLGYSGSNMLGCAKPKNTRSQGWFGILIPYIA